MRALTALLLMLKAVTWLAQEAVPSWVSNISDVGIVLFMLVVFYGVFIRNPPWVVRYGEHKSALDRESMYRDMAFTALGAGERTAKVLSKAANVDGDG